MENSSELYLLDLIRHGNMPAYEQMFSRYYPMLCAYAKLFIKGNDVCENIVQELMLWLWEHREDINVTTSLSSYLFISTRNRCLKYLSHEDAERRMMGVMYQKLHGQFESPDFYIVTELEKHIREAMAGLPETYRQAFELNRFEHKTYNEIAETLGVSPKTVDYRIRQAVKMLRAALKDYLPLIGAIMIWN